MLTEIEWWGGLLFIWGAGVYWMVKQESEGKWDLQTSIYHLLYLCAILVLSLYFYAVESSILQFAYIIAWLMGSILIPVLGFWSSDDDSKEINDEGNREVSTDSQEDDDEEVGPLYTFLGFLFIFTPFIITFILGGFKSFELATKLGWF